jgi:hypothetical protein
MYMFEHAATAVFSHMGRHPVQLETHSHKIVLWHPWRHKQQPHVASLRETPYAAKSNCEPGHQLYAL